MMQSITAEQFVAAVAFIGAFIGAIQYVKTTIKTFLTGMLKDEFKELNSKIDELDKKVDKVDIQACKNFLVRYLADIERGDPIEAPEKQRFWEEYEHYINCGGNSYIKEWVEKLKKEGKL